MEKLLFLFLFFHVSSPVQHSLKLSLAGSSGITNFPESMATLEVYDNVAGYCDTIKKKVEPKQDWVKALFKNEIVYLKQCERFCFELQPKIVNESMHLFMQLYNQTGGVHILQGIVGIEWDDETGEVTGFIHFGYDGEDILSFDLKTETWIALKPETETIEERLNAEGVIKKEDVIFDTELFFALVKKYVALTNGSLMITELPSVFLLQQTPSSPVRCFASGFYPERASLFWRKDGDDLHEDIELGEILPNTDGTFQMSVDLNISSVTPGDWRRYECVFQLFGVKDDIVTKLDKTAIKTNWDESKDITNVIIASLVIFAIFIIAAIGLLTYKLRRDMCSSSSPINTVELSELSRSESCRS